MKSLMPNLFSCLEKQQVADRTPGGGGGGSVDFPAGIDFSPVIVSLYEGLTKLQFELPNILFNGFLDSFESVLSGVSFSWENILKEPLSSICYIPPEPFYTKIVVWIAKEFEYATLSRFVSWSLDQIVDSVHGVHWKDWEGSKKHKASNATIFVALAMVLRSKPFALTRVLSTKTTKLKLLWYKDEHNILTTPITVWMTAQVSQADFRVGLYSWSHLLLPLFDGSDTHSRDLILQLFDRFLVKSDETKLVDRWIWYTDPVIPTFAFEILLRLTFPATSERDDEATPRFEKFYHLLKKVALAGAPENQNIIPSIFSVSLRLSGEGNPVLAKEATAIAVWSLTNKTVCWNRWYTLCKENPEASVALLKTLVEKWNDGSLERSSSSSSSEPRPQFILEMFTAALILAGEGNPVVAKEAAAIAIGFLTKELTCWNRWYTLCKENLGASVALLETLVEKWNLELSSLSSKPRTLFILGIFTVSLILAGKGNPVVAKEAVAIAIWSLSENSVCWERWDYRYKQDLEGSATLLKTLVEKWEDHSLKLLSSRRDTLTLSKTVKSFRLKNKNGGANASPLYREADKSCQVISQRLPGIRLTQVTGAVLVAAGLVAAASMAHGLLIYVYYLFRV